MKLRCKITASHSLLLLGLTILLSLLGSFVIVHEGTAGVKIDSDLIPQQYNRAKDSYYLLIRDGNEQQDRANWLESVREFRRIYFADPNGEFAANSLFMLAKMHYRMYMHFHQQADLEDSITYYSDVASLFPGNTLADDALFWTGEIYLKDKKNPRRAAELYAKQIELHPAGDKYGQAASRLQEIKEKYDIWLPETYIASQAGKKFIQVLPVQYWSSDDYARIVIRASRPVSYRSFLAEKKPDQPRRLFLEFAQSSIESKYTEPVQIADGLLQNIQTRQMNPATVRVALELESISTYQIFSLNDPFRVIVDVHGQQKVISASKTLPNVGQEKVDGRAGSAPELSAPQTPVKKELENSPSADREPFIILEARHKRKPGSAAEKKAAFRKPGLTLAQQLGLRVRKIVIDPGHGGKDPGAMANGLREKDITLQVAKKTAARLADRYEYEITLTRDSDTSLPLEERTAIANTSKADLFVSIHVNAHPSDTVRGIETFYLNLASNTEAMRVAARENATTTHHISDLQDILSELMQNSKIQESSILADYVQNSLISGLQDTPYKTENLGVKQAPFYVLLGAEMPAVLAEISFLSNREDAARLRDEKYLDEIAAKIAAGVAGYVEHQARAALQF
ncbi:MAG: N-acetylmuramoyl-L-alanine amidase [Desulfobulbaceae bacterium]|nr:N-acetylmuramoyl-L-alanine amidase [Desulfobulbaceae bacterium]